MKLFYLAALVTFISIATACNKSKLASGENIVIPLKESYQKVIDGDPLSIYFDSVLSDKRCQPGHMSIGVNGPATVRLKITVKGSQTYTREISSSTTRSVSNPALSTNNHFVLPGGYRFEFVELIPYTGTGDYIISPPAPVIPTAQETKLTLKVSKY
jgi:hypothetical protein